MTKRKNNTKRTIGLLLLISFLFSLNFSNLPSSKQLRDSNSVLYSILSTNSTTAVPVSDLQVKITIQLFFVSLVFFLLLAFTPKSRRPLLESNLERNYFYDNVTINAP